MEERNKYFIQRNPGDPFRNYNQKMNDMVALRYLAIFCGKNGDAKAISASSPAIKKFLTTKNNFKTANNSVQMETNLKSLLENWKEYREYTREGGILDVIKNFVFTYTEEQDREDEISKLKKMTNYYQRDENCDYFAFDKLIQDIVEKKVSNEEAINQFRSFAVSIFKHAQIQFDSEDESE